VNGPPTGARGAFRRRRPRFRHSLCPSDFALQRASGVCHNTAGGRSPMPPRCRTALLLFAVLFARPAAAATVRVFAVGNEVRVEDAVNVQAFRNKMFALVDGNFPNRGDYVQAGVDDVVSHMQPGDPTAPALVLVNFPEDVGLVAAMTGSRGN